MSTFSLDDLPNEDDVERAADLIEEIEGLVEELPERAENFGMGVSETARDIAIQIEEEDRVTKKQLMALENMLEGLRRWFHD